MLILGFKPLVFVLLILLPGLTIIAGLILAIISANRRKAERLYIEQVSSAISQFPGRTMDNCPALEDLIAENPEGSLELALNNLLAESDHKYGGRWLPPLDHELRLDILPEQRKGLARRSKSVLVLLVLGLFASFGLLVFTDDSISSLAGLLPLVTAGVISFGSYKLDQAAEQDTRLAIAELCLTISRVFPVFNDRAGVALLVDDLLQHEDKMEAAFKDFNQTARYLADSEFSEAIQRSVRAVMSEEIAPPITESARLMHDLSSSLINQQQEGMERLANQFSQAVASQLQLELNPIARELGQLADLLGDTRGFIHDSVAVLESSRQQNIELNHNITESLGLMTVAKNDLANEMKEISDNLEVITRTTEKMAAIYAGEEARLADRIQELSGSMEGAFDSLDRALQSSGQALELAATIRTDQASQNQDLVTNLHDLAQQMTTLSVSLENSSQNFTKESGEYVNQTLRSFDSGLAEVVERLIFTASAIRDAVDALPVALRPNKEV